MKLLDAGITQLLGEIARGHWGLCKASVDVIAVLDTDNRWDAARSRSVYAPVTEMTDAALRQAGDQMGRMRQQRAQREWSLLVTCYVGSRTSNTLSLRLRRLVVAFRRSLVLRRAPLAG